jgi:hypothetical protein
MPIAPKKNIPYTAYMHLADIKEGYNLKIKRLSNLQQLPRDMDLNYAGYLFHIDSCQDVIFVEKSKCIVFTKHINEEKDSFYKNYLSFLNLPIQIVLFDKTKNANFADADLMMEIKAYIDSVAGIDLELLESLEPIIIYLRKKEIQQPVCNTLKGKVHYHEIPGKGKIDFQAVLRALVEAQYDGYVTIELYNHVDAWESVLPESRKYLLQYI